MARFPPTQSDPPAAKAATPLRTGWRPHTMRAFRSGTNIAMEVALKGLAFARERSGNRDRSARGRTRSLGLKGARAGGVKSPGELPFRTADDELRRSAEFEFMVFLGCRN